MLGRLVEIHRFPVKSLGGERLEEASVDLRGLAGDRLWSVHDPDGKFGSGKSTRRFRRMDGLLQLSATYDGETPVVTFPDGRVVRGDDPALDAALSEHVGRPVSLQREGSVSHFDEGPIHLVTTAALVSAGIAYGRGVDARHLRPSLVVESPRGVTGMPEEHHVGDVLAVGEVLLRVSYAMPRCVMVDMAQAGLEASPGLLRSVTTGNDGNLGVVADVLRGGVVRLGDEVRVSTGGQGGKAQAAAKASP